MGATWILAGTDNDYSVTQNGSGTQFDVYFNFPAALADPAYDAYGNSIQCPIGRGSTIVASPPVGRQPN